MRLRRQAGLRDVSRQHLPTTTRREPTHTPPKVVVGRVFTAPAPNLPWLADITDAPTAAGFLLLAVALDAWPRRIVGWPMANDLRTPLPLIAVTRRTTADVVHHGNQDGQYTSLT